MSDGSVLLVEVARGTLSRVRPDGEIEVVAELGGGPNGAALGPDGAVYVCNNGGFRWHEGRHGLLPLGQADDYNGRGLQGGAPATRAGRAGGNALGLAVGVSGTYRRASSGDRPLPFGVSSG